jgi:hypothetical protein
MFQRWEVELEGTVHVVDLVRTRLFVVDGVEHSLGGIVHRGPRVATFELDGHPASLTSRAMAAGVRAMYRRSWARIRGGASLRRLPLVLLAYVFGGSGVGGGVAGAEATSSMLSWGIYELRIDSDLKGSWVVTTDGDKPSSWTFVEPDEPLPDRDWDTWPAPRRSNR